MNDSMSLEPIPNHDDLEQIKVLNTIVYIYDFAV